MRRLLFVVLFALASTPVSAKSLRWHSLDVTAQLDRDARLHVTERHEMVFDGDWNGGERTFRIGDGQDLAFESLSRVDGGVERPLVEGNIDQVDHYSFTSRTVLRWRSRLASDPPFANQPITYVLKYTMTGVVRENDRQFHLDHDFAFPDRTGVIEHFSFRLDLDPVWRGAQSPIVIHRNTLVSGEGVVVPLTLEFAGSGAPSGVVHAPSRRATIGVVVLFFIALLLLLNAFILGEREKGRFASIPRTDAIDEAWLREHVFGLSPEAAGTVIDGKTGADEVAAILARMALEKKISTAVEARKSFLISRQVLTMKLLVDRETLPVAERKLADALFLHADTTDTDTIQAHYKSSGFDPSKIVASGVKQTLQSIRAHDTKKQWKRPLLILAGAFGLMVIAAITGGNNAGAAVFTLVAGFFVLVFSAIAASLNARAITAIVPRFALVFAPIAFLILLTVRYSIFSPHVIFSAITPVALCAWSLALMNLILEILRTPESKELIALRKQLLAARKYFVGELHSPSPRLRDDWYPWLLAFGLGKNVDRWFGAHGAAATTGYLGTTSDFSTSSSSTTTSSPSFTGGGGAFGGGGASGGWAMAAAAIGAGVASPSSSSGGSSGGGGGSSGGGSSGGGGGGGW